MTTLTLDPVRAVLLVHGVTDGWTTVPAECHYCRGRGYHIHDRPDPTKPHRLECTPCAGSGRNPLLGLAGAPCPTCNGDGMAIHPAAHRLLKRCPDCSGSGLLTVEIWTDTTGKDDVQGYGPWVLWPRTNGTFWLERRDGKISYTWEVPLGVQVGTGTISEVLPIVGNCQPLPEGHKRGVLYLRNPDGLWIVEQDKPNVDLSHLLPYADWSVGRFALRFSNLIPKDPT